MVKLHLRRVYDPIKHLWWSSFAEIVKSFQPFPKKLINEVLIMEVLSID